MTQREKERWHENRTHLCGLFQPHGEQPRDCPRDQRSACRSAGRAKNVDRHHPARNRERTYAFQRSDLAVFVLPTYAGKLPNKLLPYLQRGFRGNGAPAVALVSFGNRAFENSLAELITTLTADGFRPVSGGAFAAEHAFSAAIGTGRPDAKDYEQLAALGEATAALLRSWDGRPIRLEVPGDAAASYYVPLGLDGQPKAFLKAKPNTDMDRCTRCGACVKLCPMGSIDPDNVAETPGVCIKCHACIRRCPFGAKYMDDENFLSHRGMLERDHRERKEPFWTVAAECIP